ncbi:Hypothetical predicted protein [Scomber scombrus]|uniref:Uncharacterized protein n=1 Tax=Scomber scombrus TaxID=13677 RepID=A0AAV1Q266_SCOSC
MGLYMQYFGRTSRPSGSTKRALRRIRRPLRHLFQHMCPSPKLLSTEVSPLYLSYKKTSPHFLGSDVPVRQPDGGPYCHLPRTNTSLGWQTGSNSVPSKLLLRRTTPPCWFPAFLKLGQIL